MEKNNYSYDNETIDVLQYVVLPSENILITSALAIAVPA